MIENSDLNQVSSLIIKSITQTATPEEEDELQQWRAASPRHELLFQRFRQEEIWQAGAKRFQEAHQTQGWQKIQGRINRHSLRRKIWWYAGSIAAVLALFIGLYQFHQAPGTETAPDNNTATLTNILPGSPRAVLYLADGREISLNERTNEPILKEQGILLEATALDYGKLASMTAEQHELVVPVAGEYGLNLADGTQVWLNSSSTLRYPTQFTGDSRIVELEGEAYFKVAKQAGQPFIVKTRDMDIRVTGTEFNVKAYPEEKYTATTLAEGSVVVSQPGHEFILKPGEQAVYREETGQITTREVDPNLYTSWKDGVFEFSDLSLGEIHRQLERWYDVKIEFESPAIEQIRFTGALKKEKSLGFILEVIGQTRAVEYTLNGKTVMIKKK